MHTALDGRHGRMCGATGKPTGFVLMDPSCMIMIMHFCIRLLGRQIYFRRFQLNSTIRPRIIYSLKIFGRKAGNDEVVIGCRSLL